MCSPRIIAGGSVCSLHPCYPCFSIPGPYLHGSCPPAASSLQVGPVNSPALQIPTSAQNDPHPPARQCKEPAVRAPGGSALHRAWLGPSLDLRLPIWVLLHSWGWNSISCHVTARPMGLSTFLVSKLFQTGVLFALSLIFSFIHSLIHECDLSSIPGTM